MLSITYDRILNFAVRRGKKSP